MESQLGADLSGVTIGTSPKSASAASNLGARAFTVGSDVHFGSGEYAPGTKEGDRLLAHELTHVIQGRQSGIQRKPQSEPSETGAPEQTGAQQGHAPHEGAPGHEVGHQEVSEPGEPAEKEADHIADAVAEQIHGDSHEKADAKDGSSRRRGHDDKPVTHAAPMIGASLAGVGRKVYRELRRPPAPQPRDGGAGLLGPDGRSASQHQPRGGGARQAQVANIQPILGKLGQAIQMFAFWAQKGTVPAAQTMLRQLETARDEAHALSEDQAKGIPTSQLEPRRTALMKRLQAIQSLDPDYRLVSVGDLARTINYGKRRMEVVRPTPWKCPRQRPGQMPEFQRQLKDQQDGINSMLSDTWEKNKAQYTQTGRSSEAKRMQEEFQARGGRPPGKAAPHNSDGYSGGHVDPTGLRRTAA